MCTPSCSCTSPRTSDSQSIFADFDGFALHRNGDVTAGAVRGRRARHRRAGRRSPTRASAAGQHRGPRPAPRRGRDVSGCAPAQRIPPPRPDPAAALVVSGERSRRRHGMVWRTSMVRNSVIGLAALALLAAGCSSSSKARDARGRPHRPAPRPDRPASPTRFRSPSGQGTVIVGSATGHSPCEKAAPTPASPGEVGAGAGGATKADVLAGEHGRARHGRSRSRSPTRSASCCSSRWSEARAAAAAYPTVARRGSRRLLPLDRVRAVHRRALHEHPARRDASTPRIRRSCSTTARRRTRRSSV